MIEMMNGQPLMWFKKRTYPFAKNDWPLLALNHSTIYNHQVKREAGDRAHDRLLGYDR